MSLLLYNYFYSPLRLPDLCMLVSRRDLKEVREDDGLGKDPSVDPEIVFVVDLEEKITVFEVELLRLNERSCWGAFWDEGKRISFVASVSSLPLGSASSSCTSESRRAFFEGGDFGTFQRAGFLGFFDGEAVERWF